MLFISLLLIATVTTSPSSTTAVIIYDSVLGYPCDTDTNCGGLVGNSWCLDGICACRPGYVPQGIMNCIYTQDQQNDD